MIREYEKKKRYWPSKEETGSWRWNKNIPYVLKWRWRTAVLMNIFDRQRVEQTSCTQWEVLLYSVGDPTVNNLKPKKKVRKLPAANPAVRGTWPALLCNRCNAPCTHRVLINFSFGIGIILMKFYSLKLCAILIWPLKTICVLKVKGKVDPVLN
jgi:hypothetical protein